MEDLSWSKDRPSDLGPDWRTLESPDDEVENAEDEASCLKENAPTILALRGFDGKPARSATVEETMLAFGLELPALYMHAARTGTRSEGRDERVGRALPGLILRLKGIST